MNKTNTITSTNAVGNVVDSFTDLVFEGLLTNYDALMWIIVLIGVGFITRWLSGFGSRRPARNEPHHENANSSIWRDGRDGRYSGLWSDDWLQFARR